MRTTKINILILTLCLVAGNEVLSQEGRIKGLRIGYDISRPAMTFFEPERKGFEISADFEPKQNYYITLEYGEQDVDFAEDWFVYQSEGYYGRAGLDYNFSKKRKEVDHYEMVFGGFRYAFAKYSHLAENIEFVDNYWGGYRIENLAYNDLSAHWFEVVGGIRGELFKNLFIGWSFRGRVMLWQNQGEVQYTYMIPGFGAGNKKTQLGFNFSVYYRIPLYKAKSKPAAVKNE